jgi:hypothetical protein
LTQGINKQITEQKSSKEEVQMAPKKPHEKCRTSLAVKEMLIKTAFRFHLTTMAFIKNKCR